MIGWVVLAQWADLGTYLLASRIYPDGEGNPLMAMLGAHEVLIPVKLAGIVLMLLTARGLTGWRRRGGLGFAIALGLLGSLTNVVFGLM